MSMTSYYSVCGNISWLLYWLNLVFVIYSSGLKGQREEQAGKFILGQDT